MRLTLRTLLAYLDDRLSSGNAREIGKKLSESPFAQELADRIRTVVRQRRLTTPGRRVKMIDPNLIAEYLDDQLTPELVSLIEKEILSSDFSLAEAAASHEIIGLLGDPVALDQRLRDRLLKQNPHRSADEISDHDFDQVPRTRDSDPAQDVWKPLAPQKEFSPRSPTLILAALLIGWLALLLTEQWREPDPRVASSGNVAPADRNPDQLEAGERPGAVGEPDSEPAQPDGADQALPVDEDPADNLISGTDPATDPAVDEPAADPAAIVPDEDADSDIDMPAEPDPATVDPDTVPADPAIAADAAPPAAAPGTPRNQTEIPAEVPVVRKFDFAVNDPHEMLLSRSAGGGEWSRASVLRTDSSDWHDLLTDRVTALSAPFTAEITPIDAGWSATFASPCLFRFNDGVHPELHLYDGRCVIVPDDSAEQSEDSSARELRLLAGGVAVDWTAIGDDFRIGVLVMPMAAVDPAHTLPDPNEVEAPGSDADSPADDQAEADADPEPVTDIPEPTEILPLEGDVIVTLFVAAGSVTLQFEELDPVVVEQGRALNWATVSGRPQGVQLSDQTQLDAVPDWVYTAGESDVPEIESAKSIVAAGLLEADSVIAAAAQMCDHRNPVVSRFAASVLTVAREVETLVQVLLQTEEEQVRIEAIRGLQQTAAQTLRGRQRVLRSLENRLPMRELSHFVRLLQGVTPAEAQQEETSLWLVAMLRHDRASIRQMAYMILMDLTGQTNGFHPDSDPGRRNDSVRRWERHLRKNDNRLLAPE